jgi:hypothetical protein
VKTKYENPKRTLISNLIKHTPEEVKENLLHGTNGWWKASTPFTELCNMLEQ